MTSSFKRSQLSASEHEHLLMAMLERQRATPPGADEDLLRYSELRATLAEHQRRSEAALDSWREALSRRWECEINAQRMYTATLRRLSEYYGDDAIYGQLVAPSHPLSSATAADLLADMRRLDASIALLSPHPPFAVESQRHLRTTADDLASAIDRTARCEAERRSILIEQRIATNVYERAYVRARRLLDASAADSELRSGTVE